MANIPYGNAVTQANYVSGDSLAKEIKWAAGAEVSGYQRNPFSSFMAEIYDDNDSSGSPLWCKQDARKIKAGSQVHFSVTAPLGGATVRGGTTKIEGLEEKERNSGFNVNIGVQRWAVGSDYEAREFTHIGSDFDTRLQPKVGELAGRNQGTDIGERFKLSAVARNTLFAGGVTSKQKLTSNDTLSTDMIGTARAILSQNGALAMDIVKGAKGQRFNTYLFMFPELARDDLTNSGNYYDAVKSAGLRGAENEIFNGQLVDLSGNALFSYSAQELDCAGPVGSFQQPEALLGTAIVDTASAIVLDGGGGLTYNSANVPLFFESFPNFAYPFNAGDVFTPASTTEYVVVYDMTDRKWNLMSYTTGNIGTQITTISHLGASSSGARLTALGGVNYNAAIHKVAFPAGSLIIPVAINVDDAANPDVVYVGSALGLGGGAMFLAYGRDRMKRFSYEQNGGLDQYLGAMSVTGCNVFTRTDGLPSRYVVMYHAVNRPGVDLSVPSQ